MQKLKILGGTKLKGEVWAHGAKNSALPILAASLIINGESVIHNCPDLSDVRASIKILTNLGCKCKREGSTVIVDATSVSCNVIPEHLMREMRSSIVFLGAIISRCNCAKLSSPGGCEIGPRPIDIHLSALRDLGAQIYEEHGLINAKVYGALRGTTIYIPIPSVGATENIMIAAACAKGVTKIINAAREPEIIDLANFLNKAGAKIYGAGSSDITIVGTENLFSVEHTVIPDRILIATYISAVAATGGSAVIHNTMQQHLKAILSEYERLGCELSFNENSLLVKSPVRPKRLKMVRTQYYPGFPTDAGPTLLATTLKADGTSMFVENIFENRFKFSGELVRLGADVKVEGRTAIVEGVNNLSGATVKCTDLRGGAALMVAAFSAEGITEIEEIAHIERGYETPEINFAMLGANIKRI